MKKILLVLLLISPSIFAQINLGTGQANDWTLNKQVSNLTFTTTKNASKTEVQSFQQISGTIKRNVASLVVNLNSVSTGIEIRDERLKDLFFETKLFPQAVVKIKLSNSGIEMMKVGDIKQVELEAELSIHGVKQKAMVSTQIIYLESNKLLVNSIKPLVINLQAFKLLKGVNLLCEIAHLKSINAAVPVTFNLMFTQQ
jgi:polyisoprenoid-binding protein YceI